MATPRGTRRIGSKGATSMERADTATKHARAIELRIAGWTQEAIAAELGYADKSGVRYVLDRWVDDHAPTPESIAELRQRMLAQLDELHAAHWPQAIGERDPTTGQWVREPSEKSSELLLKIAERKARLCGLDRQQSGIVATVTAEQVAAYLGWDPQEPPQPAEPNRGTRAPRPRSAPASGSNPSQAALGGRPG